MATIKPFRGLRYNPDLIQDLSQVISQPYDRVRHGLQERYYALSDYNVVRITKGKEFDSDTQQDNVYTRARQFLDQWQRDSILIREDQPAIYVFHQEFTVPGGDTVVRKAFITALELADFDEGIVLPHERTLSGPKIDRLNLTRATETYFGNIFMLYPDPENQIDDMLDAATIGAGKTPDIDVKELHESDVRQKLWVVTDPKVVEAVVQEMAPKVNLIIADGHHRYETALNYRNEQREKYPDSPVTAGFNYRMVTMVSMSNPGLTILPTHRMIYGYNHLTGAQLLDKVAEYFDVKRAKSRADLENLLDSNRGKTGRIGLVAADGFYLLTLKDSSIMDKLAPDRVPAWKELDVSILHELVLEHIMGLTKDSIERKENIEYLREPDMGYDQVASGEAQFLFLLNPTRMEQVIERTQVGEKMPQKSTDFYPKVITGLTMLKVSPEERL
ncbi:MAG: DUF1015 domain-containing protein [Anaerolineales bacterium]|nr:DUF1015 domain-containing protein [Anaerolineales bacterium]